MKNVNQSDLDKLHSFLKTNLMVTKRGIAIHFSYLTLNSTSDRYIRKLISELAKDVPIIATSNRRGYALAEFQHQNTEVLATYEELKKRTLALEERMTPLRLFLDKNQEIKYGK
jgi:tRNA U55 pseudouridine synthase TruB